MSVVKDFLNPFDNPITRSLGLSGDKSSTPAAPQPVQPAQRADAADAGTQARQAATARGRAATILTDELGVTGGAANRRKLGVT